MDGQFPDAEGWSLEKEKFFIELLHAACGRNDTSGGRPENNVLLGLQNRMNVEFGGFTETAVLNRFNMLRRSCKIFNVIFSNSDFRWNRAKNWITATKQKWDALIGQYPDATKYQVCGEKYRDKLSDVFDDDLGEGNLDNPSDTGNGQVQSGDATHLVPDPDYLYYLICFAFKYELE
ncbi:hypothetical protein BUALT_Bualt15G0083000 [Buddleja alternifolia]|uniref:Myb/SANT-like domain-containing protein n=1 Tax=Buddleja alternifolia TaxID=168488 RepID=A0AAV6WBV3_9LAMI|nr:hypothetical protein BUALT_Bualt15G0083000 [Buddleja alternifolia]